ncbi:MAG TPA: hypothetical protein VHP11_01345 [Tepidisphaeraceae bacterium]|nr:hypothetical protein [Tepidisphaeraceae bacterium]
MIQITCSKCEVVLTIDDAFAGGVCRCQHCGTIQTVPRELRASGTPAAGRALMSKSVARLPEQVPSLDDLEQVVASSGLASTSFSGTGLIGTGLANNALPGTGLASAGLAESRLAHAEAPPTPSAPPKSPLAINLKLALLLGACGLGLFLLGMLVTWLIMRTPRGDAYTHQQGRADSLILSRPDKASALKKPSFLGIELKGPTIIYLLDPTEGPDNTLEYSKLAVSDSVDTLGDQIAFQVIFWETDRVITWPPEGTTPAIQKNVLACRNLLANIRPTGPSRIGPSLNRALLAKPNEIVVVTPQSGLGEEFVRTVLASRGASSIRIHAVSLGDDGSSAALQVIAQQTGGQFRSIPSADLQPSVD